MVCQITVTIPSRSKKLTMYTHFLGDVCRLDNVIRSDLVIVMDAGLVKETAAPSQLLARPDSAFSSLVDASGASSAAALRKMASDFFAERAAGMKVGAKPRPSLEETRRSFQQP